MLHNPQRFSSFWLILTTQEASDKNLTEIRLLLPRPDYTDHFIEILSCISRV